MIPCTSGRNHHRAAPDLPSVRPVLAGSVTASKDRSVSGPFCIVSHHQVNDSEHDEPVAVKVPTALAHVYVVTLPFMATPSGGP